MVARYEHPAKDSSGNSFGHIVGNDQVNEKKHPCKKKSWKFGGHLEIQNGRHPEKNEMFSVVSDISHHMFLGPRNPIMTLFQ